MPLLPWQYTHFYTSHDDFLGNLNRARNMAEAALFVVWFEKGLSNHFSNCWPAKNLFVGANVSFQLDKRIHVPVATPFGSFKA